jgi:hypothetical protein
MPRSRFDRLLSRPGSDVSRVLLEVRGRVEHGLVSASDPNCHSRAGVVALLVDERLGWAVPPPGGDCAGFIKPDWIMTWSATNGEMIINYLPPPIFVHYHDPWRLDLRITGPFRLRLRADPQKIDELAHRALGPPSTAAST